MNFGCGSQAPLLRGFGRDIMPPRAKSTLSPFHPGPGRVQSNRVRSDREAEMAVAGKRKLRRPEKADANRKGLFQAAAYVVGKHGYANASIGRITERCGLAQGTFYLYFDSRQDLFDQLLPAVGEEPASGGEKVQVPRVPVVRHATAPLLRWKNGRKQWGQVG